MRAASVRCRSVVPRTGERNRSSRVATMRRQLVEAHRAQPSRRHLDRQRESIDGVDDPVDHCHIDVRRHRAGEPPPAARSRNRLRAAGAVERRDRPHPLAGTPSRSGSSRGCALDRAHPSDRLDDGGDGVDQVLAVVQHDEDVELAEGRSAAAGSRLAVGSDPTAWSKAGPTASGSTIAARSTNAEPSRPAGEVGRHLDGEPRLADAARTDQRHQPRRAEQLDRAGHVGRASDDRRSRGGPSSATSSPMNR